MSAERDSGIGLGTALGLTATLVVGTLAVAALAALTGMLVRGTDWATAFESARSDPLLASLAQLGGAAVAIAFGLGSPGLGSPGLGSPGLGSPGLGSPGLGSPGRDGRLREALAVRPIPAAVAVLCITAGLSLAFPLREVGLLLVDLVPSLSPSSRALHEAAARLRVDGLGDAIVVPLAFVAIPAVAEELFFRGLLLPGLARTLGDRRAVLVSAGLFGLIHVQPVAIVVATLAGLALGWLQRRAGSVLPCVALHGAVNAVPVLLSPELVRLRGFNTEEADVYHLPWTLLVGTTLLAAVCFPMIARLLPDSPDA